MNRKKIPILIMLISVAAISAATLSNVIGSPSLSQPWRLLAGFTGFILVTALCSYFSYRLLRK